MTAHWGVSDPAAVEGSEEEKRQGIRQALATLSTRINLLLNLPSTSWSAFIADEASEIGKSLSLARPRAGGRARHGLLLAVVVVLASWRAASGGIRTSRCSLIRWRPVSARCADRRVATGPVRISILW
jgi:hypothetical protein